MRFHAHVLPLLYFFHTLTKKTAKLSSGINYPSIIYYLLPIIQCSKYVSICRCTIPEFLFVPEFHTDTYKHIYILYPFIFSTFLTVHQSFAFRNYTGISKFPFRALLLSAEHSNNIPSTTLK
jgi:hypothetical protein